MISVAQAQHILSQNITIRNHTERVLLSNALHRTLATDVAAPISFPPFRQSAMDGYAIHLNSDTSYKVIGEIKAGDPAEYLLQQGEAVRIFTGAAVPDSATAVVPQENVSHIKNEISLTKPITQQANIRPLGEQVLQGQIALKKGTLLNPAAIGYLTTLGLTEVEVISKMSISLIVTGNELTSPGELLEKGKIYESNSLMLKAAIEATQNISCKIITVKDDLATTTNAIDIAIQESDLVIITGGISVGDYDYVGRALDQIGVSQLFYKVKQKPGKPLYFGKKGDTAIFALPGNPAAALTCYYYYIHSYIHKSLGNTGDALTITYQPCQTSFTKKGTRAQFLKAFCDESGVTILDGQSSAMLYTYALSNALVFIDEDQMSIAQGEKVKTILLP